MTFERQYVAYMAVLAAGYAGGYYGRWRERIRNLRERRLIDRIARDRSPW